MSATINHPIHRVAGFSVVRDFVLDVDFSDGTRQRIDFAGVLAGELFGPLANPVLFREVRLDPEAGTLVWPNGADFDPATLHEWPSVRRELVERARSWVAVPV